MRNSASHMPFGLQFLGTGVVCYMVLQATANAVPSREDPAPKWYVAIPVIVIIIDPHQWN